MKWSWKLGEIAGIGIYVHSTFLILLGWVALDHFLRNHSLAAAVGGVLFIITLFSIVVLHELGHALTARRFGIRTRDITLLPIGGVARLERMPDDPKQELIVALAGPAVNVVLAAALFLIAPIVGVSVLHGIDLTGGNPLASLMWVNVVLAVFNLIPAFPMDGGRVLRALLAMRMDDYVRSTQIAAHIGQAIAFLFGFIGLFSNPFLIFIALFVWIGAAEEAAMVQVRSAMGGIPISRAMITDFHTLSPDDSLELAVKHILAGFQQDFPVVKEGHLVGVLMRSDLLKALAQPNGKTRVEEVMQREFETADPFEMLESVFTRLQECNCRSLPIVHNDQLVGIVTMENLGEFLTIQTAMRKART